METKLYQTNEIKTAAQVLKMGGLVAFPTETVYGLGADALNEAAVQHVYKAKGRPSDNPLIVHVASKEEVTRYAQNISEKAMALMNTFWPGSLTLIFEIQPNAFSKTVTGGLNTAAFRMPANQATLELIQTLGHPLVGPSANTSGKPSPTTAGHVYHDLNGKIAGVLDDGPTGVGLESTVLDMTVEPPAILRPGAVTQTQLKAVIGPVVLDGNLVDANQTPKAPGMKYKHYAPDARVIMVEPNQFSKALQWAQKQQQTVGLLATDDIIEATKNSSQVSPFSLGSGRIEEASQKLFGGLRYFDQRLDIHLVLAQAFPQDGLGVAYMNRLDKAAGHEKFE